MFRIAVFAAVASISAVSPLWAQPSEGNRPFAPTRLEWLELYFNAGKGVAYNETHGYGVSYVADPRTDTIIIVGQYDPDVVNPKVFENALKSARAIVRDYAAKQGWDGWLNIAEARQPLQQFLPDEPQPPPEPAKNPDGTSAANGRPDAKADGQVQKDEALSENP